MPVEKRGDVWYLRVKSLDGKWGYQKAKGCRTKAEAESILREIERLLERQRRGLAPLSLNPDHWTVGQLLTWWLETYSAARPAHARNTGTVTAQLLCEPIAKLALEHVRPATVEELLQKKELGGLKPQTLNHVRGFLHRAFEAGRAAGKFHGENPVTPVKKRRVSKRASSTLSADMVPRLLHTLDEAWRGLFATAIYTGMRKGELCGLRKADVDLKNGRITVRRSYGQGTTKGGRDGFVPIHEELRPFLEEALKGPGGFVFPGKDGRARGPSFQPEKVLRRALTRIGEVDGWKLTCRRCRSVERTETKEQPPDGCCDACGMKLWPSAVPSRLRFHDLRHTAASLMLMAGADLPAVQRILRHRSPATTMGTYGHLADDYLAAQMSKMSLLGTWFEDKSIEAETAEPEIAPQRTGTDDLATYLLPTLACERETPGASSAKALEVPGVVFGGADGTRTRGLRRDRPAL